MAHVTGVTTRQGRIEDGNTISDYDKEEDVYKRQVESMRWKRGSLLPEENCELPLCLRQ